ncbi:hypothetical protein [Metamycoplasma neophronis]|uniref:Uncharacterized protein n=1 Tax=Metamycoplasma neophronis TaxID=872983 RepID=A0ABY2YZE0_9BACT|nr:hypothetical protein [Metamycoplasma neophronis]TPR53396.1 hypothetical protein FJR74_02690 [Metamycoplasma neophronis]
MAKTYNLQYYFIDNNQEFASLLLQSKEHDNYEAGDLLINFYAGMKKNIPVELNYKIQNPSDDIQLQININEQTMMDINSLQVNGPKYVKLQSLLIKANAIKEVAKHFKLEINECITDIAILAMSRYQDYLDADFGAAREAIGKISPSDELLNKYDINLKNIMSIALKHNDKPKDVDSIDYGFEFQNNILKEIKSILGFEKYFEFISELIAKNGINTRIALQKEYNTQFDFLKITEIKKNNIFNHEMFENNLRELNIIE